MIVQLTEGLEIFLFFRLFHCPTKTAQNVTTPPISDSFVVTMKSFRLFGIVGFSSITFLPFAVYSFSTLNWKDIVRRLARHNNNNDCFGLLSICRVLYLHFSFRKRRKSYLFLCRRTETPLGSILKMPFHCNHKNFGFLFSSFDNNLWLRRTLNFVIICFSHFNGEIEIVSWISATVVDERYCPFVIQKSDKMRKKNSSISKSNWIEMTSSLFTLSRHQSS